MPEEIINNIVQNFMPVRRPSFWQRLIGWFKLLSPKKKIFLVSAIIIGVAAIAIGAYFVFALPGNTDFYFVGENDDSGTVKDAEGEITIGEKKTVEVWMNLNNQNLGTYNIDSFQMIINASTNVIVRCVDANINSVDLGAIACESRNNNKIVIIKSGFINKKSSEQKVKVAVLSLEAQAPTSMNATLTFSSNPAETYIMWNSGGAPSKENDINLRKLTYEVFAEKINTISLAANSSTPNGNDKVYKLQEQVKVDVMLDKLEKDIVAFTAQIKYDKNFLQLAEWEPVGEFKQTAETSESHDKTNGIYTLARGRHGDGVEACNQANSRCNQVLGAILTFNVIAAPEDSEADAKIEILADGLQAVIDDGQGTTMPLNIGTKSIIFKVADIGFTPEIYDETGPDVYVTKIADDNWQAEVVWTTNVETDSALVAYGIGSGVYRADLPANILLGKDSDTCKNNWDKFAEKTVGTGIKTKDHKVILPNLVKDATYYYEVKNIKNVKEGSQTRTYEYYSCPVRKFIVTETKNDLTIKNLTAKGFYRNATVTWNTVGGPNNGLSNSAVYYIKKGTNTDCKSATYSNTNVENNRNTTLTHIIRLNNLESKTTYCLKVVSASLDEEEKTIKPIATAYTEVTTGDDMGGPDANVVLKVERDRQCDTWLECLSSLTITNTQGKQENLCFDLGVCKERAYDQDSNSWYCSDSGDESFTSANSGTAAAEQVFKQPETIEQIKNLSGLSKVGLEWPGGKTIAGDYHYGAMTPVGVDLKIANPGFNSGEVWPWVAVRNATLAIVSNKTLKGLPNRELQITPSVPATGQSQWFSVQAPIGWMTRSYNYVYAISFGVRTNGPAKKIMVQLKLGGTYYTVQEVEVSGNPLTIVLTTDMRDSQFKTPEKTKLSGEGFLAIGDEYKGETADQFFTDNIYIDNISVKSVLPVKMGTTPTESGKVVRSCRIYPSSDAVACDFASSAGKIYRGWQGFCVEKDTKIKSNNPDDELCLNWWPVDILPGESNIFGEEKQGGYQNRMPLYYCMQEFSLYPYYNHSAKAEQTKISTNGTKVEEINARANGFYGIRRDEIVEVRINNIKMIRDIGDTGISDILNPLQNVFDDMWAAGGGERACQIANNFDAKYLSDEWKSFDFNTNNPAEIGEKRSGTIVFNQKNKEHWDTDINTMEAVYTNRENISLGIVTVYQNDGGKTSVNPYAFVRCDGMMSARGGANDLNTLTAKLVFDNYDMLEKIVYEYTDAGVGDGEDCNGGLNPKGCINEDVKSSVQFDSVKVTFVGGRCNVIAQVVDPEGKNYAWASRVVKNGWKTNNFLGYLFDSDYAPYGAAVVPEPVSNPAEWKQPLYIMPADKINFPNAPHQVRAGMPYGILIDSSTEERDKPDAFKSQCVAGDSDKLGDACLTHEYCGVDGGFCAGVDLSSMSNDSKSKLEVAGENVIGKNNLQNLFAKSLRVWRWNGKNGYQEVTGDEDYTWDITKDKKEGFEKRPKIVNIAVNGSNGLSVVDGETKIITEVKSPKAIALTFYSTIDLDHLPLTDLRVDWGDDTPVSQINNLKIMPTKAHTFTHTYECPNASQMLTDKILTGNCADDKDTKCLWEEEGGIKYCQYIPSVQVQDNWGWCNNGTETEKCPDESAKTWQPYLGVIRIESEEQ